MDDDKLKPTNTHWLNEIEIDDPSPKPQGPQFFDAIKAAYNEDWVKEISARHGFALRGSRFKWWVHSGAKRYHLYKNRSNADALRNITKYRISLEKQLKEIKRFQKIFELAMYTPREFKHSTPNPFLEEVESIALRAMKHQDTFTLEGELFKLTDHHRQLADTVAMERFEIEEHLEELKVYKGGRPAHEGAYEFVAYVSDFWTGDLERPYTIDAHNGQGLTEAFKFIRDCAEPLIPLTDSQILTMMQKFKEKSSKQNRSQKPKPKTT
tara:strand:+ start:1793 stop:2593 length:801 start_codon:yes stop_codon:yes gene_type:complete